MKFTTKFLDAVTLVRLAGDVNGAAAGQLYDLLVAAVSNADHNLIVDVSRVPAMTRAGTRGIVVAAYLMHRRGGMLRICGANPACRRLLQGLGYDHLITYGPSTRGALPQRLPTLPGRYGTAGLPSRQPDAALRLRA